MVGALSTLDTIGLVLVLIFAIRGAFKGFAWQAFRTVGLVGAFWAAFALQAPVGTWLRDNIQILPDVATPWIASVVVFVTIFGLATWFAWMARGALKEIHFGGMDRLLGFVFGGATGLVILTIGFFVWGQFFANDDQVAAALKDSISGPAMRAITELIQPYLSEDVIKRWDGILDLLKKWTDK
jgi:uncharacterized membrane protein required for colicin V production